MNTTTAIASLGVPPDIEQRASAVLREMGWSVAEAVRLLLTRIANEGRFPLVDGAAQDAEDARAAAVRTFRDKSTDELTDEDCEEMLRAMHRGEPPPPRPSWESLAQYLPVDVDFLSERPDVLDFERADKLFEGWE